MELTLLTFSFLDQKPYNFQVIHGCTLSRGVRENCKLGAHLPLLSMGLRGPLWDHWSSSPRLT